jgi:hypothetical protein
MSLSDELQDRLRTFAEGDHDETQLFAWLASVRPDIDREIAATRELWDNAFVLLAEVRGIPHDAADVRADVHELLASSRSDAATITSSRGQSPA